MSEGAWVLVGALLMATGFGAYRAASDGRFRGTHEVRKEAERARSGDGSDDTGRASHDDGPRNPGPRTPSPNVLANSGLDLDLGARATLLQFSSAFCAPCRATRRILSDVAAVVPGVVHLEVDAEQHLALVRRVGVVRTPTTLILDPHGGEVSRASGAPRKEDVLTTLARALDKVTEN